MEKKLKYKFDRYDTETCNCLRDIFGEEEFNDLLYCEDKQFELRITVERVE